MLVKRVLDPHLLQGRTAEDAYLIYTASELAHVATMVNLDNYWATAYYKLMEDIDLTDYANWVSIGTNVRRFKGHFNGNGKKITNLTITSGNNIGLFGYCVDCHIYDLGIDSGSVISNVGQNTAGAICGAITGTSIVERCYNSAYVKSGVVGGIVGSSDTQCYVRNCANYGEVVAECSPSSGSGYAMLGGCVGYCKGNTSYVYDNANFGSTAKTVDTEVCYTSGCIGRTTGSYADCYYNSDTCLPIYPTDIGTVGTAITDANMKSDIPLTTMSLLNYTTIWKTNTGTYPSLRVFG